MPAPKYRPGRGGHAPEWMRESFENSVQERGPPPTVIGKLWCSADTMPSSLCEMPRVRFAAPHQSGPATPTDLLARA